jgi:nitrogen fixation/metabolism regulation signal transduction histidine kinase
MNFKHFNLNIIIRVILIGFCGFLFAWALLQDYLMVAKFTIGFLFLIQIYLLIIFIQKTNKKLISFLELIRNEGLMERFSKQEKEITQKQLNAIYNEILQFISEHKTDKEGEHYYFQNTLEVIGTSIISLGEDGKIEIFNHAARELLQIESPKNFEDLEASLPEFALFLHQIKNNEQKLFTFNSRLGQQKLSIRCSAFSIKSKKIRLYSFQNISPELESEEIETWQKLIQVLRHEIMNSITPINSLTNTLIKLVSIAGKAKTQEQISNENIGHSLEGLQAIQKRNRGLLRFVETYRKLTKLPEANYSKIRVSDWVENIKILMNEDLTKNNIQFISNIKAPKLEILADEKLISQLMINLIKNAIEALVLQPKAKINLKACYLENGKVQIQLSDNGIGIAADNIDKVFIPFYSTKKDGSGIGLSLCRQIMYLHKGSIGVQSEDGKGTIFSLVF